MKIVETKVNDFAPKPIIDVEVSNGLSEWKRDYLNVNISLVGIFYKNKIKQIILENDEDLFKDTVIIELKKLLEKNKVLFALNNKFERLSLFALTGLMLNFEEVRSFNYRWHKKDDLYNLLIKHKDYKPIFDPFEGDGGLCIKKYKDYREKNDSKALQEVLDHNTNCLLKENCILCNKDFFTNH